MGRISGVPTKQTAASATVSLASSVVYMPISRLVKSFNYGNGLNDWNTYTLDYETDVLGTYDGPTNVCNVSHTRTDGLNLTNTWDSVTPANNQSLWYTPSNRLQNADGPWGQKTFNYDGVGNRTYESTVSGGITTTDNFQYPSTSNRVDTVVRGASTIRTLTYDAAGNIATDARSGTTYGYTYNRRNRLQAVSAGGITQATYVYDANEKIAIRDSLVAPAGVTHYVHDIFGNIIAQTAGGGATGATGTVREYIWLYETEIAPTMGSRTTVDRPLAVVNAVNTASPATWWVSVDHLNRPVKMTNSAKAAMWTAVWQPRAPIGRAQRGRESAAPTKWSRRSPSPAPPCPHRAINLVIPSPHRHLCPMDEFNYQVPAEVYASRGRGAAKRPMTFYRFASAAEAIRFVMEDRYGDRRE